MTDTASISSTHTLPPEPTRPEALRAIEAAAARLRAEIAASADGKRKARLLVEVGELEERVHDETGAVRDYLEALSADPDMREAAEALARLFERRRSLKHTGKIVDAFEKAALTGEDLVRAKTMRALLVSDAGGDVTAAIEALEAAMEVEADDSELGAARFLLELFSAKAGDKPGRAAAAVARARAPGDFAWRALLLIDAARLETEEGHLVEALALLEEARDLGGTIRFVATRRAEVAARAIAAKSEGAERETALVAVAAQIEAQARLIGGALDDTAAGDDAGVPRHVRSPAHFAHAFLRAAETLHDAGDLGRAGRLLDEALAHPRLKTEGLSRAALATARIRIAEELGDTALASQLSSERLAAEENPGMRAAFALRVAEHAASIGDGAAAQAALAQAAESDPTSVPARALAIDLAAAAGEPTGFASQLESLAKELPTGEASARALLFAAVVWATEAGDETRAKAALAKAETKGAPARTVHELSRSLATFLDSAAWYDEGTQKLLALGGEGETSDGQSAVQRRLEMVRGRLLSSDVAGAVKILRELAVLSRAENDDTGAWISALLLAFLPTAEDAGLLPADRAAALDRLADLEPRTEVRLGLALLAARFVQRAGDANEARRRLIALLEDTPESILVTVLLSRLEVSLGLVREAAATLRRAAAAATEADLAGALELEAGFLLWGAGERAEAAVAFESAADRVPKVGVIARAWALRGLAVTNKDARIRAIDDAEATGESAPLCALERMGAALSTHDASTANVAVEKLEDTAQGELALAGALARLIVPEGGGDEKRFMRATDALEKLGGTAESLASAERFAAVRGGDSDVATAAASRWFAAGGGVTAGLEWLAASMASGSVTDEARARRAIGGLLGGDMREALYASAAIAEYVGGTRKPDAAPLGGSSDATRLANLELAPPGADPRRREAALADIGRSLGDDARIDALGLRGWSLLVSGDATTASRVFEEAATARSVDLGAWEGLRTAADMAGDLDRKARASTELGKRCKDPVRAAAFWEEAGLVHLERNDQTAAEAAFAAAFERDAQRAVAFDKLFRRVRDRRDGDRLLVIIQRRLEVSDDPPEISKLFWEQARVLREKGDIDGALKALENVTMIEPEHVGALALSGEIFIKRGQFDEAATTLAALAALRTAPAKSRLTAGIAAVDLYENKLDRFDRALDVLIDLHKAGLSTLPVRERLARAAARTGAWNEAIAILEQLMQERSEASGRIEAARLAMAIHRDRLRAPERATAPVLKLLEEAPNDGEAIDMLLGLSLPGDEKKAQLVKARGVLLTALRLNPIDLPNAERLVRVAKALGDREIESVAVTVAAGLGSASAGAELSASARRAAGAPEVALTDDRFAALLAPGDEGPLATLFAFLGPTLAEALGPSLSALGVNKRDRVDAKTGLPLRSEIAAWAGAFGIQNFDLYVGGRDGTAVQGVPGEVPALVVGPEVSSPLDPAARARVARELLGLVRGTTVLRLRDETTTAAIVVVACRLADVPIDSPAYAVLGEIEKAIAKAIPRRIKKSLYDVCREIAQANPDARDFRKRALASQARAAVVASGDISFVLQEMLEGALERVHGSVRADERATELLRFVLSPTYSELRGSLGLGGHER
jgi:tetratricopeptide (TPR) repeat protein